MPPMIDARDVRANHSSTDARIVATKLSYALPDGRELLHDLTIAFGRERTGPIGPNGSGKTTLLRLLAGELQASSGAVHRTGTLAMLPQEFRPEADDTLAVVLGINDRLQALRRMGARSAQAQVTDARVRAVTEREVDERRMRAAAARRLVEERDRLACALRPSIRRIPFRSGSTVPALYWHRPHSRH